MQRSIAAFIVFTSIVSSRALAEPAAPITPDDSFPRFIVPGHEAEMASLRSFYWLHYRHNGPMATLWDAWLPPATLWPATGDALHMRERWAAALSGRRIDAEGYVSTHQHDGLAHAQGWPFPLWNQGGGVGWHFASTGIHGYDAPRLVAGNTWTLSGATGGAIDARGWNVALTGSHATLQPPAISLDATQAPFLRLNWRATGLSGAKCYVEWITTEAPRFSAERHVSFAPATGDGEVRTMIAMYKQPAWRGTITSLRIGIDDAPAGAALNIKSFHSAYDSRHNVNNFDFIRGVASCFNWTGDTTFLRSNIDRVRIAMRFAMDEFQTRQRNLVFTPWVGHEGTSGVRYDAAGKKSIVVGRGIGSNYWDLLPFGGEDALATIYYYDTLGALADLEQAIVQHPQWKASGEQKAFDPAELRSHAAQVKRVAGKRFWNDATGRFVAAIDRDGVAHDYGFTFLNTEAICHGFATPQQAESIVAWLSGQRAVAGDTSSGDDIYHFRFGPRSTTRRNTDYYFWAWSNPESIPWGGQVQDGGAVLGWSYHDLMARLATRGPDDAWQRLREIIAWFDDTQRAGGYRAYYRDGKHGTLQGNNTAGGLGVDAEFVESVLVPQVMLYGFLGFEPTPTGLKLNPRLPDDWPSLQITGIRLHDAVLNVGVSHDDITITPTNASATPMTIELPSTYARLSYGEPIKLDKDVPLRSTRKE